MSEFNSVCILHKELVKRWVDNNIGRLQQCPIEGRKQAFDELIKQATDLYRDDFLEEIKSRNLSL